MEFGVWLPVYGGWLRLRDERHRPHFSLCQNVAHIAEAHGFDYLYASGNYLNCVYGPKHEAADVWVYLSALAATTSHLTLVGGVKPGFLSPFVMAHMINSLDWVSDGRACLNVVCGWWRQEFEHCGVGMLDHRGRYRRAAEYMRCLKGLWTKKPFSFEGEFYVLRDVLLAGRPMNRLSPSFWISGHSDDAICLAATQGEVLFVNGMELHQLAEFYAKAKREADAHDRQLRVASNAFVLLEDSDRAAQQRYEQILARRDHRLIAEFRSAMDASGAAVWAVLSETKMVDSNAGFEAGLIGSPRSISEKIREFKAAGVDILMCQFEDTEEELPRFASLVQSVMRKTDEREFVQMGRP
jgi:FMNH2-dependent dimethyl sulfone monooxygenase